MKAFQKMALSFPHTEQVPHFERVGFKITGMRMFTTYLEKNNTANIFLTPSEQKLFCKMDKTNIYPVPNKWGEKGATTFELNTVARELVMKPCIPPTMKLSNRSQKTGNEISRSRVHLYYTIMTNLTCSNYQHLLLAHL